MDGVGSDERLSEEIRDAVLAAKDRGVATITILVSLAASLGTVLGDNATSVSDMRKIARALGKGVENTADKVFSDRLDRR